VTIREQHRIFDRFMTLNGNKYYDYERNCLIDLNRDGCDLAVWHDSRGKALFARHPDGFMIFLPPEELEKSDEYKESDPYAVEAGITEGFHKRRIDCTLAMVKEVANRLGSKPRILDLGCGQGHITARILQECPHAEVSGLDYSVSAIKYAHAQFRGVDFIVGNAYQCPYAEGYFDMAVCNNLWEHVPDPLLLLAKIKRVLRPGGFIIISTPSRYRWNNLLRAIRGKPLEMVSKHHVTEYSVGQVVEQLQYGGFKVLRSFSKPIKATSFKFRIARLFFSIFVALTGSHHQLETTVFYLAQDNAA
jgi:2-polyprenyl-3-methyl-5-hydroxy-6-metoxy-1,4-benzoquinol methylase